MIFITDELGKFEKNIIELAENVGFKECKTIEAIDLFCGISERNDVLKEKDRYYACTTHITPQTRIHLRRASTLIWRRHST